ncbi:10655_t:CDS:2 [Acaulospora morrowiae]|uniref:10655_t:CDS:1 n=1 Tax=Acaulospora morrowiae TaxID=94023 RepID=A0A9N9G4J3_9GLOM|nr:10655_t:CDS:2 [Acaulospora morrowiae]
MLDHNPSQEADNKKTQVITNEREVSPAKNISPPIEDQSDKDNGITLDPMSEHNSTQTQRNESKSLTDTESSITSLPQDIIDADSAETLDFVERKYKECVSEEVMERIREKKLRDQNLSSDNSSSDQSNLSCDVLREQKNNQSKSHNAFSDLLQNPISQSKDDLASKLDQLKIKSPCPEPKLSTDQAQNDTPEVSGIPSQIEEASTLVVKIPYNQKVEQGLLHELFEFIRGTDSMSLQNLKKTSLNSIFIKQISDVPIDIDLTPGSVSHLAHLFGKAEKTGRKEKLRWYYYSEGYEKKVSNLSTEKNISDQMARTQIYNEIMQYLPGIKREYCVR